MGAQQELGNTLPKSLNEGNPTPGFRAFAFTIMAIRKVFISESIEAEEISVGVHTDYLKIVVEAHLLHSVDRAVVEIILTRHDAKEFLKEVRNVVQNGLA